MTISGFDLQGSFDMLVTPSLFRIDVNQMAPLGRLQQHDAPFVHGLGRARAFYAAGRV